MKYYLDKNRMLERHLEMSIINCSKFWFDDEFLYCNTNWFGIEKYIKFKATNPSDKIYISIIANEIFGIILEEEFNDDKYEILNYLIMKGENLNFPEPSIQDENYLKLASLYEVSNKVYFSKEKLNTVITNYHYMDTCEKEININGTNYIHSLVEYVEVTYDKERMIKRIKIMNEIYNNNNKI